MAVFASKLNPFEIAILAMTTLSSGCNVSIGESEIEAGMRCVSEGNQVKRWWKNSGPKSVEQSMTGATPQAFDSIAWGQRSATPGLRRIYIAYAESVLQADRFV
jgi:hypothetical protein